MKDSQGNTPLHVMCEKGDRSPLQVILCLINGNPDSILVKDKDGTFVSFLFFYSICILLFRCAGIHSALAFDAYSDCLDEHWKNHGDSEGDPPLVITTHTTLEQIESYLRDQPPLSCSHFDSNVEKIHRSFDHSVVALR